MSEFSGPSLGWYDPPEGHAPECNCSEICHTSHIERLEVVDNANSVDFQCCRDEIDLWVEEGIWCKLHGDEYMHDKKCEMCRVELYKRAV